MYTVIKYLIYSKALFYLRHWTCRGWIMAEKFRLFCMALLAAFLLSVPAATAQIQQVPLSADMVQRVIVSYPGLKAKAEELGKRYDAPDEGFAEGLQAWMMASSLHGELNTLAGQYGFDSFLGWLQTVYSVAQAYAFAQGGDKMDAQIAEALAQIDSNPNIPAAQKEMLRQQIQASAAMIGGMRPSQENIDAVTPFLDQLKPVLEEN